MKEELYEKTYEHLAKLCKIKNNMDSITIFLDYICMSFKLALYEPIYSKNIPNDIIYMAIHNQDIDTLMACIKYSENIQQKEFDEESYDKDVFDYHHPNNNNVERILSKCANAGYIAIFFTFIKYDINKRKKYPTKDFVFRWCSASVVHYNNPNSYKIDNYFLNVGYTEGEIMKINI